MTVFGIVFLGGGFISGVLICVCFFFSRLWGAFLFSRAFLGSKSRSDTPQTPWYTEESLEDYPRGTPPDTPRGIARGTAWGTSWYPLRVTLGAGCAFHQASATGEVVEASRQQDGAGSARRSAPHHGAPQLSTALGGIPQGVSPGH